LVAADAQNMDHEVGLDLFVSYWSVRTQPFPSHRRDGADRIKREDAIVVFD
jgi:hypothetical protein